MNAPWPPASDPPSWPRSSSGELLWGEAAGALVAPLPPARPRYEPLIVTTLRRYSRRGASIALLQRLAGGARNWRVLNRAWDLDGSTASAAVAMFAELEREAAAAEGDGPAPVAERLDVAGLAVPLSAAERRIALVQIVADHAERAMKSPTTARLASFLGVDEGTVEDDVDWLRMAGAVTCSYHRGTASRNRRVRLAAVPA
jgi:hypothetical protein